MNRRDFLKALCAAVAGAAAPKLLTGPAGLEDFTVEFWLKPGWRMRPHTVVEGDIEKTTFEKVWDGYISDLRITRGVALYSADKSREDWHLIHMVKTKGQPEQYVIDGLHVDEMPKHVMTFDGKEVEIGNGVLTIEIPRNG